MTFEWCFKLMTVREGNARCIVLCSVVGAVTVREIWLTCMEWFLATATHVAALAVQLAGCSLRQATVLIETNGMVIHVVSGERSPLTALIKSNQIKSNQIKSNQI